MRLRVQLGGRLLLALTVLGFYLIAAALAATALTQDTEGVTVSVNPGTVRLTQDGNARVLVIVENGLTEPIRRVRVRLIAPSGISVPKPFQPFTLTPGSSSAKTLEITRTSEGALPVTALVRADYVVGPSAVGHPLSKVTVVPVEIKAQEAEPLDEVAKVEARSALASLDEFSTGTVTVVVTNTSSADVTVTEVDALKPDDVKFDPRSLDAPVLVGPGHQGAIPIEVSLKKNAPVRTGMDAILLRVDLKWGGEDNARTASVIVSHNVKLGVFAESDVAELLKIPSFLVLPGFLFLMTVVMMRRFRLMKAATGTDDAMLSSVPIFGFWVIVCSGILIAVYWAITRRDIRAGYNFNDILGISILAILSALVGYLLLWAALSLYARWRYPREGDDTVTVLRKLDRQGLSLHLYEVKIKNGPDSGKLWLLERRDSNRLTRAVGTGIAWKYVDGTQELEDRINRYQNQSDPKGLAKTLHEAIEGHHIEIWWELKGAVRGVRTVPHDDVEVLMTTSKVTREDQT